MSERDLFNHLTYGNGSSLLAHALGSSSVKYGCLSASSAVILFAGFSYSILSSKSKHSGVTKGNTSFKVLVC